MKLKLAADFYSSVSLLHTTQLFCSQIKNEKLEFHKKINNIFRIYIFLITLLLKIRLGLIKLDLNFTFFILIFFNLNNNKLNKQ